MGTLLVSDLHLGAKTGSDVARRPELRAPLLEALDGVDQVVLLGDVLELRDGRMEGALEAARGFFEDLGEALGPRRVVLAPGNHDYHLIAPWLERRRSEGAPSLGLEQRVAPAEASAGAAALASWLGQAELELAYPGLWLRPDVYATHGHYVDLHITVPSFERLGARTVNRVVRGSGSQLDSPDDYESVLRPIYALLHEVAQVAPSGTGGARVSERAWRALVGDGRRRLPGPARAAAWVAWPATIAALNRAGLGPLSANLSGPSLRRASVAAMGEVVARLDVRAEHVIFGHTHRAGPFVPRDDPAEWVTPAGPRVMNSGCWLYSDTFLANSTSENPYWPGVCVRVDAEGPPEIDRLLGDRRHDELRPR